MEPRTPTDLKPPDDAERHLGDGLYASFDGWQIELYTHDGRGKTNRVFLEPEVLASFEQYLEDHRRWLADQKLMKGMG